jgi:Tol biopolymer transport system component
VSAVTSATSGLILGSDATYGNEGNIFTIRPDGTGKTYLTEDGPGYSDRLAAWSYDGLEIVYTRQAPNDIPRIWIMRSDGSEKHQLTFGALAVHSATFSPDGTSILFGGGTTGTSELWLMKTDGTNLHPITNTTGKELSYTGSTIQWSLNGSYSPDGTRIVYASTQSGTSEIWVANADGSGQTQLTFANDPNSPDANAPSWSPDGSRIAFWSGFAGPNAYGNVFTMNPDGSGRTQLTFSPAPKSNDDPAWSPDGKAILFDSIRDGSVETWIMNANGDDQRALFAGGYGASRLPITAGGAQITSSRQVAGVGDFTGDGSSDVLFRDSAGNLSQLVTQNGQSTWQYIGWASPGWQIAGIGDFNADGTSDILFDYPGSDAIGEFAMHDGQASWVGLGQVPAGYKLVGVGDFHGNGTSDILLRNPATGDVAELRPDQGMTFADIGWAGSGWEIAGTTDLNADGTTDIVFHYPNSGAVGAFQMEDGRATWVAIGSTAPDWAHS